MDTAIHYGMLIAETLIINEVLAVIAPPLIMIVAIIGAIHQARRFFGVTWVKGTIPW